MCAADFASEYRDVLETSQVGRAGESVEHWQAFRALQSWHVEQFAPLSREHVQF